MQEQPLQAACKPVAALAAADGAGGAYAAALGTQQAVVDLAVQQLGLEPVHSAAAPEGTYACTSQDGAAGAAVQAYRGSRVHWLSSSALANPSMQFGTCRLLAYVPGCSGAACCDVPHLALEQTLLPGGSALLGVITLSPRQSLTNDLGYLRRYFCTTPAAAPNGAPNAPLRCYNDLLNAAYEEAGRRPGWRHYQSPAAEVKPLLATSIAYTFPPDQENLELFRGWALEAARLWVGFLQGGGSPPADEAALHRFDNRWVSAIVSDPGNPLAVKLFGEEAVDTLLKMATGHPKVHQS